MPLPCGLDCARIRFSGEPFGIFLRADRQMPLKGPAQGFRMPETAQFGDPRYCNPVILQQGTCGFDPDTFDIACRAHSKVAAKDP